MSEFTTEEQAKTKWCPFSRVVDTERYWPPHNRRSPEEGNTCGIPVTCLCIASDCGVWQWEVTPESAARAAEMRERYPLSEAPTVAIGYCGLARR